MSHPMSDSRPPIRDFKPFLGYGPDDYDAAKRFYETIGFEKISESETVCCFDTGTGRRFLVTLHHGLDRSTAGMMHLWVESVDAWYDHRKPMELERSFPGVKVAEPAVAEWGWRILYVWDPGGWLLHIAEPHSDEAKTRAANSPPAKM